MKTVLQNSLKFGKILDRHRTKSPLWKKVALLMVILLSGVAVQAQSSYPKIYQNWDNVFESPTHYEVSVKIVQCDSNGSTQIMLELLNEGDSAQTASVKLYVKETVTGDTMVKKISYSLGMGEMILPTCGSSSYSSLRFNLPSSWDATKVEYSVTLIP